MSVAVSLHTSNTMNPFQNTPRDLVVHILMFDPRFAELFRRVPRVRASPSDIAPALAYDGNHRNVMEELHRRLCFWSPHKTHISLTHFRNTLAQVQTRLLSQTRGPNELSTSGGQFITDARPFPVRALMRGRTFGWHGNPEPSQSRCRRYRDPFQNP
jgi:hypothetical protein